MDLNAACSGFVYGLEVGTNMIKSGAYKTVLVVGTEKLHHLIDFTDRTTCVLFGDGAGAVVLEPTEGPAGVLASDLGMDGYVGHILEVPVDGTAGDRRQIDPRLLAIYIEDHEVYPRAANKNNESTNYEIQYAR